MYTNNMNITSAQCRGVRNALSLSRAELAEAAGLGERTIVDFERGARVPNNATITAICLALSERGIIFGEDGQVCIPSKQRNG